MVLTVAWKNVCNWLVMRWCQGRNISYPQASDPSYTAILYSLQEEMAYLWRIKCCKLHILQLLSDLNSCQGLGLWLCMTRWRGGH